MSNNSLLKSITSDRLSTVATASPRTVVKLVTVPAPTPSAKSSTSLTALAMSPLHAEPEVSDSPNSLMSAMFKPPTVTPLAVV